MTFLALLPVLIVALGALGLLLFVRTPVKCKAPGGTRSHLVMAEVAIGVLILAIAATIGRWEPGLGIFHPMAWGPLVAGDNFANFLTVLVLVCGIVTIVALQPYAAEQGMNHPELYPLVLFALSGMIVLVSGTDLMVLFLGLEIMSLAIYALVGLKRQDGLANEAALKYLLLGAFSSAIFLFGVAFCFGATGTTHLQGIARAASGGGPLNGYLTAGLMLLLGGLAFKVAAFPFHMWAPDVYQGAPAPITGFMATAVKAASFALFMRVVLVAFLPFHVELTGLIGGLAIFTMFVGNLSALRQTNVKRMLAYSSIAHTGYLLVGLAAVFPQHVGAASAMLYYLAAYSLTNLGAFACVAYLSGPDERRVTLESWAGIGRKHPVVAVMMGLCLLSLIGFPPTAGFFGKYLLFWSAMRSGLTLLALLGILNSILSAWYYLRVVVVMLMREPSLESGGTISRRGAGLAALYATLGTAWAGVGPFSLLVVFPGAQPLLEWARSAVQSIF